MFNYDLRQGSAAWHRLRRMGIGASEVAAIMGLSPWSTPTSVWEVKTGRAEEYKGNARTQRGNEMEPAARAYFELYHGLTFDPVTVTHPDYPFIRASLDGYNDADGGTVLEIKCPGEEDHALALAGKVPDKYMVQVQDQLMITRARRALYGSYFPDAEPGKPLGVVVEVLPDPEMQSRILEAQVTFWREYVEKDVPPPLTDRDRVKLADPDDVARFTRWREAKQAHDRAAKELEAAKADILERYTLPLVECAGVTLTRGKRVDLRIKAE